MKTTTLSVFRVSAVLSVGLFFTYNANSQSLWRTQEGAVIEQHFGDSIGDLGDIDMDGFPDYVVAYPAYFDSGGVAAYSGLDGSLLYSLSGDNPGRELAILGDINGDSITDFAFSELDWDKCVCPASVFARSGADGTLIHHWIGGPTDLDSFGIAMAPLPDLDLDNVPDIAICAPAHVGATTFGLVHVYSGSSGMLLWTVDGTQIPSLTGVMDASGLDDVNGDGRSDVAVLAAQSIGGQQHRLVQVYSGLDGSPLHGIDLGTTRNIDTIHTLGYDKNGDGVIDLVVAGPDSASDHFVAIHSGLDGSLLTELTGIGAAAVKITDAGSDISGDGVGDVLMIRRTSTIASHLEVRSGVDLSEVYRLTDVGHAGSVAVRNAAAIGDITGDGRADLIVSDLTGPTGPHIGSVSIFTGSDPIGTAYCVNAVPNSSGQVAVLEAVGSTSVGDEWFSLRSFGLPQNVFGIYLASTQQGFLPGAGGSAGNLCLGGAIGRFNATPQILFSGSTGAVALGVDIQSIPQPTGPVAAMAGVSWHFQLWHRDVTPGSSNFSTAVSVHWE